MEKNFGYGVLAGTLSSASLTAYRYLNASKLQNNVFKPLFQKSTSLMQKMNNHILPISLAVGGATALGSLLLLKKRDNALRKIFDEEDGFKKFTDLIDIKKDPHNTNGFIITNKWLFDRNPIKALANYLSNLPLTEDNYLLKSLLKASQEENDERAGARSLAWTILASIPEGPVKDAIFKKQNEQAARDEIFEKENKQMEEEKTILAPSKNKTIYSNKENSLEEYKELKRLRLLFLVPNAQISSEIGKYMTTDEKAKDSLIKSLINQKQIEKNDKEIYLHIWKISSEEKWSSLVPTYIKNSILNFAVFIVEKEEAKEFQNTIENSDSNVYDLYKKSILYPEVDKPYTLFIVELNTEDSDDEKCKIKKDNSIFLKLEKQWDPDQEINLRKNLITVDFQAQLFKIKE